MTKVYLLLLVFLLVQLKISAQTPPLIVKGTVLNEQSVPIENATITEKGTQNFTTTSTKGQFTLKISSTHPVLLISCIGYKSIEAPATQGLRVQLKSNATTLEDVEVTANTGFQKLPKVRATGSFTVVSNKLFNEQVGTDVLSRLTHIANGFSEMPKRASPVNSQIMIRGFSTIAGPREPLIVVDNFPFQGNLNNLNPNDVESITFLKDAAAASIWGSKAGNGVIVITTKSGKLNQPVRLNITSNVTLVEKPDLFKIKSISPSEYIDVERFLFTQRYRFADTNNINKLPFSPVYEILFKRRNSRMSAEDSARQIDALRSQDLRQEFMDYFYQTAINQQYALNVSGGTSNLAWYVSGGLDKNLGELHNGYNRVNISINNVYKINSKLDFSTSVRYTDSKSSNGRPAWGSISSPSRGSLPLYTALADQDGNALPVDAYLRGYYTDTVGAGKLLPWKFYPLVDYQHTSTSITIRDMNAVLGANYKIYPWLNIDLKYRYQKQQSTTRLLQTENSYNARHLINTYTQINRTTGQVAYKVPRGSILDLQNAFTTAQDIRAQLNFDKAWQQHAVNGIIGVNSSEAVDEDNRNRTYGYNNDVLTYSNVDYANTYPSFIVGGASFIPSNVDFNKSNIRFASFYGNAAYTYAAKYTLSASARRDASNLFGVNTNDKWKLLWSVGFSWDLSKESFYKISFLPYARLRLTYGFSGNVDPSKVAVTTLIYGSNSPYTLSPLTNVNNFTNPDLRWEKAGMINYGLDFKSKNNRITGSVEYYRKRSTDLYSGVPIDPTFGLGTSTVVKNSADLNASGFDVQVTLLNIDRQVKWSTDIIVNTYKSKVTRRHNSSFTASSWVGSGAHPMEGYPLYTIFAYPWAGLDAAGDPQGLMQGQPSKNYNSLTGSGLTFNDLVYAGSSIPLLYGAIGNSISYKRLSISVRISYRFKYVFLRESIHYGDLFSKGSGHSDFSYHWQKPGDESVTNVPAMVYPINNNRDAFYNASSVLITKGDHIRLQYINVGYDVIRTTTGTTSLRLYTVINNLGIVWKKNKFGIDPDYPNSSMPPSRVISFGAKLSF